MSTSIAEEKRVLRRRIDELQMQVPADVRANASLALCGQIRAQAIWRESERMLLFSPLPQEPDIRPLLEEALSQGKTVAVPRFECARREYDVFQVRSMSELAAGYFGILEPAAHCPVFPLNRLDFLFVPGVAFDLTGRRLGRGKGYFDRLLTQVRGHKCGVAFEWQVVTEVPIEPHDIGLDSILTPSRWHRCAERCAGGDDFIRKH